MNQVRPIRIATRAGALALWQARHVAELIRRVTASSVQLVEVTTEGDQDRLRPLTGIGGAGVFTRGVQQAVLDGRADVAVHSLKDLPTVPVGGLVLAAVPQRASACDALVLPRQSAADCTLCSLPTASRVGTGSPRRRAQLWFQRRDLEMCEIRGNVETRIARLDAGQYDAVVLAEAGLSRLGLQERISAILAPPVLYPAVGQGALGVECRVDNAEVRSVLDGIDDLASHRAVLAERRLLAELQAGCHAPLGVATTTTTEGQLTLEAVVLDPAGRTRLTASATGGEAEPQAIGRRVASDLLAQGAQSLMES